MRIDNLAKTIVFIFTVAIAIILDEYVMFPAIFHNVPLPFDWLLVVLVSFGELVLLAKEAGALFR
jgi:hypothetical protein